MSNYRYSTGAKRPRWGGEKARRRTSQAANRQRGEKARHQVDNLANLLQEICEKPQSNVTLPARKAPFAVTNEYGFAYSHEVKTTNSIAYTN